MGWPVNSPLCVVLNVRIVGEKEIEKDVEECSHALILVAIPGFAY
jgi:hypothetical protein